MTRTAFVVASLALVLSACRGSDTNKPTPDSPNVTGGLHIQDVQNDSMAPGTPVALKGVVVTAIDAFGAKTGDIWVEEPGGGEFSGIHVFGAPAASVSGLALGDIVDIDGAQKDEFALATDMTGRTLTELKPVTGGMMTVTKTGTGTVPAPKVIDALAIGQMPQAAQDAEWEKWEGVLITVMNVQQSSGVKNIGSGASADPTFQKFQITGNVQVESSLAAFPMSLNSGTCLASVTGVGDYFFDHLIFPRTTAEIVTGGTGCPAPEGASHAICSDGIDNDGNGFADCADNGCIVGDNTCRATTTISAIQAATPMGGVELDNVYVSAVSFDKKSVWLSTSLTAAPNEGVYAFHANGGAVLDASVVVGAKVNVIGKVTEFNDDMMGGTLTEVDGLKITVVPGAPGTVVPVAGQTVAQLKMAAIAPTYESVLVTLTNVNVSMLGTATTGFIGTGIQSGMSFGLATDAYRLMAADMGCHATITGLWTNLEASSAGATTKPNAFGFIPVTLSPVVATGCN